MIVSINISGASISYKLYRNGLYGRFQVKSILNPVLVSDIVDFLR